MIQLLPLIAVGDWINDCWNVCVYFRVLMNTVIGCVCEHTSPTIHISFLLDLACIATKQSSCAAEDCWNSCCLCKYWNAGKPDAGNHDKNPLKISIICHKQLVQHTSNNYIKCPKNWSSALVTRVEFSIGMRMAC